MSRDRTLEDTFFIAFTTRAFATGIPTTLAGTPVVSAYEDAGLTQITAGITLGIDHDGVTGLNMLTIVATAANGYETIKDYNLVITAGTVGGVSVVGEVVGQFSLGLSAAAVDLANATDGLGAIKAETAAILLDTGTTIPATLGTPTDTDLATDIANLDTNLNNVQKATVTKNATYSDFQFPMKLTSDHFSAAIGKSVSGERSLDAAAYEAVSGTIAEVSDGMYQFDAVAADTNADSVTWRFFATDCDDTVVHFKTST